MNLMLKINCFKNSLLAPKVSACSAAKSIVVLLVVMSFSACTTVGGTNSSETSASGKPKSDKALIHAQLARGYMKQKQYAVAKSELDKALRVNSNHSDSNYVMGLLMLELKQYEEAETHFSRAVKGDPNNSSAAHDFGMFLCQIGKERKAVEYFEKAVDNPLFERAELSYMRAGECLSKIGDEKAEAYLKQALNVNPRLRPALYRLAVIKHQEASYMSARAYIERYFAITKPQPASLLLAYKIESSLNATEVANEYRTKLLEGFPGSSEASALRKSERDQ